MLIMLIMLIMLFKMMPVLAIISPSEKEAREAEHVALIPRISGRPAPQQLPTEGHLNLHSLSLFCSLS